MSLDLSTSAGVLRFCELRRAEMVACFERLGRYESNGFACGAYVFATHDLLRPSKAAGIDDWRTGKRLAAVEAALCRLPSVLFDVLPPRQHTTLFGNTLRAYAKITRAIGSLVMMEMWSARAKDRDDLPDDLSQVPGRMESLYMMVEHSAVGRRIWLAEIKRDPTRLEPWKDATPAEAKGRLVDLTEWRS